MRQDDDEFDPSADPRATPSDEFVGLGSFGYSSGEMPAVAAIEQQRMVQQQQAAWNRQQRLRAERMDAVEAAYRARIISGQAYDFLQTEFSLDLLPEVYQEPRTGRWFVWSAQERELYTLTRFEAHVRDWLARYHQWQESLPIDHPERATQELPIPTPELLWGARRWPAACDSELAPHRGRPTPRPVPAGRATPIIRSTKPDLNKRGR